MHTYPGSARDEAERLVAAVLGAASAAARGFSEHGPVATGSPECCVCPLCRVIAAMREPSPEFAERVSTGAGDLAAGVASLLRSFAPARPPAGPGPAAGEDTDEPWRAATRDEPAPGAAPPPKPMAKKAVKKAVKKPSAEGPADQEAAS